jgi:tetratricopeptide (TPR) repeat protein
VPADWPERRRLDIWQPAGLTLAYAHLGLSEEVFECLQVLKEEVQDEWAMEDYFQYTYAYTNQYRETRQWEQVERYSREYVDWVTSLSSDDPRLAIAPITLTGAGDETAAQHAGEWWRWSSICSMLASRIAQARYQSGGNTDAVFAEVDEALTKHEAHCQRENENAATNPDHAERTEQSKEQWKHLSGSYAAAGEAACETGHYDRALHYLQREEELSKELSSRGPLYLAAALCALGQTDEAKEQLRAIYGCIVTNGQCRTWFGKLDAFDAIRRDGDMVELVGGWERVEKAGAQ